MNNRWRHLGAIVVLVALTAVLYLPVGGFGFVNWDDDQYIVDNSHVNTGLSWENSVWAFTTGHLGNWHPLTWLSHQVDCSWFEQEAIFHHGENAAWHIANTVLLYLLLIRWLGRFEVSAIVAALFALHPLHVESVAWVSERKDLLSTFFALLAIHAYTNQPCRRWLVTLLMALSLLCKPMFVTLPALLVLLDAWPLNRGATWRERIIGKWPLWLLSVLFSLLAIVVQRSAGALQTVEAFPLDVRLANVGRAYWIYLGQMLWPIDLSCLYLWPLKDDTSWSTWSSFLLSGLVGIIALAAVTWWLWKRRVETPWLFVGWSWYVLTLLPVIGLVQIGWQTHADRYTYWPLVGIFLAVIYELARRLSTNMVLLASVLFIAGMLRPAREQVQTWKTSETLFKQAIAVDDTNWLAHFNLALYYQPESAGSFSGTGRVDQAVTHYRRVLELEPRHVRAMNNLGILLARQLKNDEALDCFKRAVEQQPTYFEAWMNLGQFYDQRGDNSRAVVAFGRALECQSEDQHALQWLASSLMRAGNDEAAIRRYEQLKGLKDHAADKPLILLYAKHMRWDDLKRNALRMIQNNHADELYSIVDHGLSEPQLRPAMRVLLEYLAQSSINPYYANIALERLRREFKD